MRYNVSGNHSNVLDMQTKPYGADVLLAEINAEEVRSLMPLIVFYSAILIVGVVGNFLVLLVYTFRYKRSPARIFILFLASIDFSICLFGLPYHLIDLTHPYTFTSGITCKILTFVITTLFYMSVFGLIVIAIDRYLNICKPLSNLHISFFKKRRACLCAAVSAVLFSWPNLVLYGPSEMESLDTNITGYACYYETKYLDTTYPLIFTISMLFVCVSSTVFLVVVYLLIYIEIYRSYKGIAKAKSIRMKYDYVSQTDEVSLKSFGKPKNTQASRVHFITKFDRKNKSKDVQIESEQNNRINMIFNPKNKGSLNNNKNADVRKSLLNNEDKNQKCDNNDNDDSDNKRCRFNIGPMLFDIGPISNQYRFQMEKQEQEINDSEGKQKCICHEQHKTHSTCSKSSSSQRDDSSNSGNSDDISQQTNTKNLCDKCSSGENNDHSLNDKDRKLTYGSSRSINSIFKSKLLSNLFSSKSVEGVANSTSSLERKPQQGGGFPMCQPQILKRRSLGHCGLKTSTDDRCQRSVSLGNINGVHLGAGLRFQSSSSGSVCKSINKGHSSSNKAKHSKITKIMLTITIVFLLSYAPALIVTILSVIKPDIWDVMSVRETIVCEFFLRFYLVNNVCNPFIYGFWDKRFLREIEISFKKLSQRIKDVFCCCISDSDR